jgi:hypothetical protein
LLFSDCWVIAGVLLAGFFCCCCLFVWASILLCNPGWHRTWNPPTSTSCLCRLSADLQVCTTIPSLELVLFPLNIGNIVVSTNGEMQPSFKKCD